MAPIFDYNKPAGNFIKLTQRCVDGRNEVGLMLNKRALEINNKSFLHLKARSFYRYKIYYAVVKRFSVYALEVAEIETSPTFY